MPWACPAPARHCCNPIIRLHSCLFGGQGKCVADPYHVLAALLAGRQAIWCLL